MSEGLNYDRDAIREALLGSLGTVYDCTRVWAAWGHGTMGPDDFRPFDQQDDRVEEVVGAIVAALPQPPEQVKCDGSLGDPLKDNHIAALINKVCRLAREFHNHDSLRQRIAQELVPALRPQSVPMTLEPTNDVGLVPVVIKPFTPAQRRRLWDNSPEIHKDAASITGFERIVSLTERAHGIGAPAGGEVE